MKTLFFILFFFLAIVAKIPAQITYMTSMKFTFSGGSEFGSPIGSDCGTNDIVKTVDATAGVMKLEVNKICHSWSFLQHWMGCAYAPKMVFNNRYIEMRIKSDSVVTSGLSLSFQVQGGCPAVSPDKSIPAINYTISKADTWETKLFKLGGNGDTITKEIDYFFPNGTFYIDYVYYGDAAIPKPVTASKPADIYFAGNLPSGTQYFTIKNVYVPERSFDGLVVKTKSKNETLNVAPVMNGSNYVDETDSTATISYTLTKAFETKSADSILISIEDTTRKSLKSMAILVSGFGAGTQNYSDKIHVYPTCATEQITIDFPEFVTAEISILNLYGCSVLSKSINGGNSTLVDVSGLPAGTYFCRISNGNTIVTKRIIKQ